MQTVVLEFMVTLCTHTHTHIRMYVLVVALYSTL